MSPAPFYQDELVTIYHGDFRRLDVWSDVRCVITDPPYEETDLEWDRWPRGWPGWVLRRAPEVQSLWCFGSLRLFQSHAAEFRGWKLAQDIVWEKPNGSSMHTDRFRKVHELAAHYYPRRLPWGKVFKSPILRTVEESRRRAPVRRAGAPGHWNHIERAECTYEFTGTRLARSVIYEPAVRFGVSHATPKPLPILRDLIAYSAAPRALIADPMCGSGSTLVAAKELGRRAIGADADLAACREAAERCSQSLLRLPI